MSAKDSDAEDDDEDDVSEAEGSRLLDILIELLNDCCSCISDAVVQTEAPAPVVEKKASKKPNARFLVYPALSHDHILHVVHIRTILLNFERT